MKKTIFVSLFIFIGCLNFAQAQENGPIQFDPLDSLSSFLKIIEKDNKEISNAYNQMSLGLKAKKDDTLRLAMQKYTAAVTAAFDRHKSLEVATFLKTLQLSYSQWMESIVQFNASKLSMLKQYHSNRVKLLASNPEADLKYSDQEISNLFKELESVQSPSIAAYGKELERLKDMLTPVKDTMK